MEKTESEDTSKNIRASKYVLRRKKMPDKSQDINVLNNAKPTFHWSDVDINTLLDTIKNSDLQNLETIAEALPHKSLRSIRQFLKYATREARKRVEQNFGEMPLDYWIKVVSAECHKASRLKYGDSVQLARVIKYLSIDGLIEYQPLPELCNGIDFCAAYKLLYQALTGNPLQPVNKETAEFILASLAETGLDVISDRELSKKIKKHIDELFSTTPQPEETPDPEKELIIKKPVKSYKGKRKMDDNCESNRLEEDNDIKLINVLSTEANGLDVKLATTNPNEVVYGISIPATGLNVSSSVTIPTTIKISERKDKDDGNLLLENVGYNPLKLQRNHLHGAHKRPTNQIYLKTHVYDLAEPEPKLFI